MCLCMCSVCCILKYGIVANMRHFQNDLLIVSIEHIMRLYKMTRQNDIIQMTGYKWQDKMTEYKMTRYKLIGYKLTEYKMTG